MTNIRLDPSGKVFGVTRAGQRVQGYAIKSVATGEISFFWGARGRLEYHTPETFARLYEDVAPPEHTVHFFFQRK